MSHFEKVKDYLLNMGFTIDQEDKNEELVVVNDPDRGISNLVMDCEDPILILEQVIMPLKDPSMEVCRRLLQINRSLVHGAFCLDDPDGKILLFRDTLQLENLDLNELEGSIDALSLAMAEHGAELLSFVGK